MSENETLIETPEAATANSLSAEDQAYIDSLVNPQVDESEYVIEDDDPEAVQAVEDEEEPGEEDEASPGMTLEERLAAARFLLSDPDVAAKVLHNQFREEQPAFVADDDPEEDDEYLLRAVELAEKRLAAKQAPQMQVLEAVAKPALVSQIAAVVEVEDDEREEWSQMVSETPFEMLVQLQTMPIQERAAYVQQAYALWVGQKALEQRKAPKKAAQAPEGPIMRGKATGSPAPAITIPQELRPLWDAEAARMRRSGASESEIAARKRSWAASMKVS